MDRLDAGLLEQVDQDAQAPEALCGELVLDVAVPVPGEGHDADELGAQALHARDGAFGLGEGGLDDAAGYYSAPGTENKKESEAALLAGLKKGDLKFVLAGAKLKGEFALVKTGWDKKSWLLLKKKDKFASAADVLEQDRSAASGKLLEELAAAAPPAAAPRQGPASAPAVKPPPGPDPGNAPRGKMPHNVAPMLASALKKPFSHPDWLFEVKWDGYRAIAETSMAGVRLYSRNRLSLAGRFPPVTKALAELAADAVLDGEVVAVDKAGIPDFQLLQDYRSTRRGYLIYYVFDLLFYRGRDLTGLPLIKRKELLKALLPAGGHIRYSEHMPADGVSFFRAAKQKGQEGIMAKHIRSIYRPGARSRHWLKIKNRAAQDCVIAGFTAPRGSGRYFGSLVLGAYEKGRLVYVGHSGGGAGGGDPALLYKKLLPLARKSCPLKPAPPEDTAVTWLKPELVCEVAFTEWTAEGLLRQPVFLRLREDKAARDAVKEKEAA